MEKLDDIIEQLQGAVKAHGDQAKFLENKVKPLVKKDSPGKFLGLPNPIKALGSVVKGIKNRDEYGGGVMGAIKGTAGEITGGTEKNRNENINNKLDEIISSISKLSGEEEPGMADITQTSAGAAPLSMANNKKFGQFMSSPQQSPYSNRTGGKNSTFNKDKAVVMMAVSDPNTKTSGSLFKKKV
jgi:hypothetical protein